MGPPRREGAEDQYVELYNKIMREYDELREKGGGEEEQPLPDKERIPDPQELTEEQYAERYTEMMREYAEIQEQRKAEEKERRAAEKKMRHAQRKIDDETYRKALGVATSEEQLAGYEKDLESKKQAQKDMQVPPRNPKWYEHDGTISD